MKVSTETTSSVNPTENWSTVWEEQESSHTKELPYLFPDTSISAPIEELVKTPKSLHIQESAKKGAETGFKIGLYASIWGIPFAHALEASQYKGNSTRLKLKARKAKHRLPLYAFLCFPGIAVGGVGAATGWLCGAAAGATPRN